MSEKEDTIKNTPEWKAGVKFLDDCMVKGDDERFSRFYDFIAGWHACMGWQKEHCYTEQEVIALLVKERERAMKICLSIFDSYKTGRSI